MRTEQLKEKLEQLSEQNFETSWTKDDLWMSIDSRLTQKKSKHGFLNRFSALPWAAIALLAIGIYWWSANEPKVQIETELISTYEEVSSDFTSSEQLDEGKQLIYETCNKELEICSSPQFKHLYEELLEIEKEKTFLLGMVDLYGKDEIAIKALIQLENAESSITSELISMIVS